ncbi:hypothetical protein AMAG_12598 [Allomyces macrogynus ATCC 38327]|uniref:Uncharacterized protein n=1 Tax=Allomyces macrogynus (strain ATCC 38327) TaxID=578462 RepID=A0A0L0SZA1_ALLM3|nr:hypothetical protein AMAG_12598 [Allomyces macrogynus ATCC 38327]|eukprot:KNE67883.1 hypothetical protein AMAG_12598 [Allomyces macrogynus ATCC 38327]
MNNTKQLFATHSLEDLAAIAAKLKGDVAKREKAVGTTLGEAYPALLESCRAVQQLDSLSTELKHAMLQLRTWAPSAATGKDAPKDVSPAAEHAPTAWTRNSLALIDESMRRAEDALDTHAHSLIKATVHHAKPRLATEFLHHAATVPDPRTIAKEYAQVEAYLASDLLPQFLASQTERILDDLHADNEFTLTTAIERTVLAYMTAIETHPDDAATRDGWLDSVMFTLGQWARDSKATVAPSTLAAVWARATLPAPVVAKWTEWLAHLQLGLHRDTVDSLFMSLQAHLRATATQPNQANDVGLPAMNVVGPLQVLREAFRALLLEQAKMPDEHRYYVDRLEAFLAALAPVPRPGVPSVVTGSIQATIHRLQTAGQVLGESTKVDAMCMVHLKQWIVAECTARTSLLENDLTGAVPSLGLVSFLLDMMASLRANKIIYYPGDRDFPTLRASALATASAALRPWSTFLVTSGAPLKPATSATDTTPPLDAMVDIPGPQLARVTVPPAPDAAAGVPPGAATHVRRHSSLRPPVSPLDVVGVTSFTGQRGTPAAAVASASLLFSERAAKFLRQGRTLFRTGVVG